VIGKKVDGIESPLHQKKKDAIRDELKQVITTMEAGI
jgi:hypothetical protein